MTNVTEDIKRAINVEVLWSIDQFYLFLEDLKQVAYQVSYWDSEDVWASILRNGKVIGYLWHKYPLLLITVENLRDMSTILSKHNKVVVITVEDLTFKTLVIDYEQLIADRLGYIDYKNPMSASDIWFSTS